MEALQAAQAAQAATDKALEQARNGTEK